MSRNVSPWGSGVPLDYESGVMSHEVAAFFNSVYGWMAAGLGLTALVAYLVSLNIQTFAPVLQGPGIFILFIAQIGLVMTISAGINRIGATAATALFLLYSALNGLTLSVIFLIYAQATLASAFLVTGVTFGVMSLYGAITQTDLTRFGNLLFMLLVGIVLASVANMFFASSTLDWLVTYGGVAVFVGLTAYDTQRLKSVAISTSGNAEMAARYSIVGALVLYLDFINLFLFILRIMGNSRRR